jgi:hypothetical protein
MPYRFGRRLYWNLSVRLKQKNVDCPRRGRNNHQALRDAPRFLIGEAGLRFGGNARGLTLRVREKRETRVMLRLRFFAAW